VPKVNVPPGQEQYVIERPDGSSFTRKVSKDGTIQVEDADLYHVLAFVQGSSVASNPDTSS